MSRTLVAVASFLAGVTVGVAGLAYVARRVDESFKTNAHTVEVVDT